MLLCAIPVRGFNRYRDVPIAFYSILALEVVIVIFLLMLSGYLDLEYFDVGILRC